MGCEQLLLKILAPNQTLKKQKPEHSMSASVLFNQVLWTAVHNHVLVKEVAINIISAQSIFPHAGNKGILML